MTTAHRPTFDPARGGTGRGETDYGKLSQQFSSKDMPSHTILKYRHDQQKPSDKLTKKDLLKELEEREINSKKGNKRIDSIQNVSDTLTEPISKKSKFDSDDEDGKNDEVKSKFDKDNESENESDASSQSDNDSDNSDSEDDNEALLAELARIKKERAEAKAREEAEKASEEERIRNENLLKGNPLLTLESLKKTSFSVERRWDDDVVFKNCAKGQDDKSKRENTFINDTIRSAFHRKFMDRYIK
ncbi:Protein CWC15 homolog [Strongyloides ratti]|uniref:Protein CWC15 homolog n=1 Tax=Strongyloides ratti TaxID=34506 RepID=A0A090KWI7_STRRB|nr:Protein CWC15 homolog [Strongyloides ratti]CEF61875.1 Protein CWC15 homolog [Strongyloides ratti]